MKLLSCLIASILLIGCTASHKADPVAKPNSKAETVTTSDPRVQAAFAAVRRELKSPSTAKFTASDKSPDKWMVVTSDDDTLQLMGHVDSMNSYGSMLRGTWIVKLRASDLSTISANVVTVK